MFILEFYNWDFMYNYYIESEKPITKIEFKEKLLKVFEDMTEDDSDEIYEALPAYFYSSEECNKFKKALKKQGLYLVDDIIKEDIQEYTTLSSYKIKLKNDIILEKITNELSKHGYNSSYGYNNCDEINYKEPHLYITVQTITDKTHYNEITNKVTDIVYNFCQKENIIDFFGTLEIHITLN